MKEESKLSWVGVRAGGMRKGRWQGSRDEGDDRSVSGLRRRGGDFKGLNTPEGGHE